MHDTVIRGGTIVDGTGGAPFVGDVAIDGGMVTAVGAVEAGVEVPPTESSRGTRRLRGRRGSSQAAICS